MGLVGRRPSRVALERQLDLLAECGVRLREGFAIGDLLFICDREDYESQPFVLTLCTMGSECEADHRRGFLSDHVWWFDTECITDGGDYVAIVRRVEALTGGDLRFDDVRATLGNENAAVEATLDGFPMRFEAKVQDDWVDPDIFVFLDGIVRSVSSGRRLTYHDLGGQDCLIGCATAAQLNRLRNATGMAWRWLCPGP